MLYFSFLTFIFKVKFFILFVFPIARKSRHVRQALLSPLSKNMHISFDWNVCTWPWKFEGSRTMPLISRSEIYCAWSQSLNWRRHNRLVDDVTNIFLRMPSRKDISRLLIFAFSRPIIDDKLMVSPSSNLRRHNH